MSLTNQIVARDLGELLRYIEATQLLAEAQRVTYSDSPKDATRIIERATKIASRTVGWDDFWDLRDAVMTSMAVNHRAVHSAELETQGIHKRFEQSVSFLLPEAKIAEGPKHPNHYPDFWLEINRELYPVEIKKKSFDDKAVQQLARYMRVFGAKQGYAVAPTLSGQLLDGMVFVRCE